MADLTGKKSRFDQLMSILQLVTTVVVGVVVAKMINDSNQELQLRLAQLEGDIDKELVEFETKTKLSHLELLPPCQTYTACAGPFELYNNGLVAANNLVVSLQFEEVSDTWRSVLTDSASLKVLSAPPALKIERTDEILDALYEDTTSEGAQIIPLVEGANTIQMSVSLLPPKERLKVLATIGSDTEVKPIIVTRTINLTQPPGGLSYSYTDETISGFLEPYLQRTYKIASLGVYATCDNCEAVQRRNTDMLVSSLVSFANKRIDDYNHTLEISYLVPADSSHIPDVSPMSVAIVEDPAGGYVFQDVVSQPTKEPTKEPTREPTAQITLTPGEVLELLIPDPVERSLAKARPIGLIGWLVQTEPGGVGPHGTPCCGPRITFRHPGYGSFHYWGGEVPVGAPLPCITAGYIDPASGESAWRVTCGIPTDMPYEWNSVAWYP